MNLSELPTCMVGRINVIKALLCNREFITEFDRLRGTNLSCRGSSLEISIDRATGRFEREIEMLASFADKYIIPYAKDNG